MLEMRWSHRRRNSLVGAGALVLTMTLSLTMTIACGPRSGSATTTDAPEGAAAGTGAALPASGDASGADEAATDPVEAPAASGAEAAANEASAGAGEVSAEDAAAARAAERRPQGPGRGLAFVVLHDHELLGSEGRALDKARAALRKQGFELREDFALDESGEAALLNYLAEKDPVLRADTDFASFFGDYAALIVVHVREPVRRVARGEDAIAVLVRGDQPERVWMQVEDTGIGVLGKGLEGLAALVADVEGVKG